MTIRQKLILTRFYISGDLLYIFSHRLYLYHSHLQNIIMNIFLQCGMLICLSASCAMAQEKYSPADSAKAKAYFNESWKYNLHSNKHQLYLDSALMVMPTNAYYWQQKSMPLYKAQKYEVGKPFLDSAVKYDADNWLGYRAYMKCIFAKEYKDALADLHLATALYGDIPIMDHPYSFYISLCHLQLNNLDSCEYYLKGCINDEITKYKDESWVHYNHLFYMGALYYQKAEYTTSITWLDKALKQYGTFSDAQYYKSMCCYQLDKKQEALDLMKNAYANLKEGYSLNEDNDRYEYYPYQVRKYYVASAVDWMGKELKEK